MIESKARGVLLGLAAGDALGRPVEFSTRSAIESEYGTLTEMVGQGTWNQPAGTTTDDTAQALAIARSLVERGEFDPTDIAERFVAWYESDPFDIGAMTRDSIRRLQQGEPWHEAGANVWRNRPEGQNAGNGSVMRAPPLAVAFMEDDSQLVEVSRKSSKITHADQRCTYGTAVLNLTIAAILRGDADPLGLAIATVEDDAPQELLDSLAPLVSEGSEPQLATSGYVIHTLQTALHDGLRAESAEEAIVQAVNRGGDTDTVGAVTGAITGARFGADAIPDRWTEEINEQGEIEQLAEGLSVL